MPGGVDINGLNEEEEDRGGDDDGSEDGNDANDEDDGAQEVGKGVEPLPEVLGEGVVTHIHVLGESVDDPTQRGGVEEGHGTAHNVVEHALVHLSAGIQG